MNPSELERMVKSGLEIPPQGGNQNMVQVQGPDGNPMQVPADVGTFFALNSLIQAFQQLNFRLDAIHEHLAGRDTPQSKSTKNCPICTARNLTPEQVEELKEQIAAQRREQEEEMARLVNGQKDKVQE